MSEAEARHAIELAVGGLTTARVFRVNVGVARMLSSDAIVRYGVPGAADLSGVIMGGRRLEIEVKTGAQRLSAQQRTWRDVLCRFGALHIVAVLAERLTPAQQRDADEHALIGGLTFYAAKPRDLGATIAEYIGRMTT